METWQKDLEPLPVAWMNRPDDIRLAFDKAACRRVAALFPRSLYLGIDLMFTSGFRRHAVLEVNAFGDLRPGILHLGRDTYTAELAAAVGKR